MNVEGGQVWTANAGDSRCAIGSESAPRLKSERERVEDKKVIFETEDHKPQSDKAVIRA